MGHAGGEAADREHLLRLHHHFFQAQPLGDVVDADHRAAAGAAHQRVEGQGVVAWRVDQRPGDPFDTLHAVLLGSPGELRKERLERGKGEEHRLVDRIVQAGAGKLAGLLIPLRDVELLVHRDQRRRHGVDDAVEVVLETGELLLDLAAHLHFQFQLAVRAAGFLGQALGLLDRFLGIVAGALELLLAGLDAGQHGVERVGQAADLVAVAALGAEGVVLLAGDLPRQFLEIADRPGDQAAYLLRHQQPEQHADAEDRQAGGEGSGVERARQFTAGHQQQVAGAGVFLGQFDQRVEAVLAAPPVLQAVQAGRQLEGVAALQVGQHQPIAVVQGRGAQRLVIVELAQQDLGGLRRTECRLAERRVGDQPADGLHRLGGDALLGNPVGGADERQVGHQQHGGQQDQQGGEQFLPYGQVVEALAQVHGLWRSAAKRNGGQGNAL